MAGYSISIRALSLLVLPTLISSLLIQTAHAGVDDGYLNVNCTGNQSSHNLTDLFTKLHCQENSPNRFWMALSGNVSNVVHGLSLCRGNTSYTACSDCLSNATAKINENCHNAQASIIWYDQCLLKYSDQSFIGQVNTVNRLAMVSPDNTTIENGYNDKAYELLTSLTNYTIEPIKMFASGTSEVSGSTAAYGMVQCTKDITLDQYTACLTDAITDLRGFCDGKVGGRVFHGSCLVKYDIHPFLE